MAELSVPTITKRGEGQALWFLGHLFEIRATGEQTGGRFCAVEMTVAPKLQAAPPHTHDYAESIYILEGKIRFHVGNRDYDLVAGDFFVIPRGIVEWFENVTDQPARVFVQYERPGMEKFFLEVAEPAKSRTLPLRPTSPPDLSRLAEKARKYGTHIQTEGIGIQAGA